MEGLETASNRNNEGLVLFATSRPSRTDEVICSEEQVESRRAVEFAWGEKIGMDVTAIEAAGKMYTGSPTGTKKKFQLDDFVDDFPLPGGPL